MAEEKNAAEPSGASDGSVVCPYVTGNVTRYCTLTPFILTDAEREAIERAESWLPAQCFTSAAVLRGLLERTK